MKKLYLKFGDEIRNIGEAPNDYNSVIEKSKTLFGIQNPAFKYKSEDEIIVTICDESDYNQFLSENIYPFLLDIVSFDFLLLERKSYIINNVENGEREIRSKEPAPKKRRRLIKNSTIQKRMCENIKIEENQESEAETDYCENEEEKYQQEISAIACEICGRGDQEENMLLCDKCNSGCHTSCGFLAKIPKGDWFCSTCRKSLSENEYKKLVNELIECSINS